MSAGPYVLVIDWLGRPLLANQANKMHWAQLGRARTAWGDAAIMAARIAKLPPLDRVTFTVQPEYPSRRNLPDPDGCSPCVKGIIDGLVRARFLPDDTAAHVAAVTYLPPRVKPGAQPGIVVTIRPRVDEVQP